MNTLIFRNTVLETTHHKDQIWFTSSVLAKALQYARGDFVTRIYERNKDEFTSCMTETVNLTVSSNINGLQHKNIRIFSLRGAHLIAMFASTPVAKEFRKWVLDILEGEVRHSVYQTTAVEHFTHTDTRNLARLVWCITNHLRFKKSWNRAVYCALRNVTNTPSPMPFEVRHIPLLADECRRIYYLVDTLREAIFEAENQTLKRVLRKREDADVVLTEIQQLFECCHREQDKEIKQHLNRWHETQAQQFVTRQ